MADNFKTINDLDISFKEFMPGQIIQSAQFNDDMRDIEEKVNEVIGQHNEVASTVVDHLNNKNNPHEVTAHQVGTYTTTEVDEFIEDIKHGHLYDRSITNEVLADWSVDNRTIKDRTITASKVEDGFGNQIDISENIEITGRYTKNEVDELVRSKVGEGTYTKEEIDEKFQNFQSGQIIDKTISADKVTSDFGDNIDISNNISITNRYTKGEVDMLISMNGLPRDWGNITEQVDVDTGTGSLPVAGHMVAGQFTTPATPILDIDVKENVEARGEYSSVGKRLDNVDSQIKEMSNQIDNIGIGSLNLRDIQIGEIFVLKTSTANIPVTAVALNKSTLSLNVGDSETLIPIITPDNATSSNIIWSCSNDNANVEGGTVTALKEGSCIITATSDDTTNGTIKATCNVTCTNVSVQSVSISGDTEISTSSSTTLTANIIPSNATNKEVSWSVNNNNVTLTPDGLTCTVTGVIEGTSSITVKTADGNKTATCDINISKGVTVPDECDIPSTNLQGYYKMSNLSSDQSQILDISGNSRNMTIYPANMTIGDGYYTKNNVYNHINTPDFSSHDSGGTQFIDVFGTDITLFITIDANAVTGKEAIFGLENAKGFGACTFNGGVIIYNNSQTTFNQVQSSTSSCLQGLCTLAFVHNGTTNKDFIYKDGVLLNEQDSKVDLVNGKVADYLGIGRGYGTDYGKIKFYNWAVYNNVLDDTTIQSISTTLLNNAGGVN